MLKVFGPRTSLSSSKSRPPRSLCICALHLSLFTALQIKIERCLKYLLIEKTRTTPFYVNINYILMKSNYIFHNNKKIEQKEWHCLIVLQTSLRCGLHRKTVGLSDLCPQSICCDITHHVVWKTPLYVPERISEKGT